MAKISGSKNILINAGIILFFIVISYAFLSPLLEGKTLDQSDINHFKGMSKELVDYRAETGKEAVWTNSMFSGMPGYMISVLYPGNLAAKVHRLFQKSFPLAAKMILYFIGFFVLLLTLGVNRWLSVVGAIAFGLSSYFIIILSAGHNSKADAIGYLPLVIAGAIMVFRGKQIPGALLFTLGLSLELLAGHPQITYYGVIILFIYGIVEFIFAFKEKSLAAFSKSALFLVIGALIAFGMNFSRIYTAYEYAKYTIRGPSELSSNNINKTSGLDKDYIIQYSYGIGETFTLLIPNFKGGATQIHPGVNSESYEVLRQKGVQNPRQAVNSVVMYHGDQPPTSGPVYLGAIVVFLFILGLFVVKGRIKWWLLAATIVSIVLSWGGNVMGLTSFLLDYLPLYNKFRAPSMTLVIAQITVPLLGFIALNDILLGKVEKKDWLNGLKWAAISTGGFSLLFALAPGFTSEFSSPYDLRQQFPDWLIDAAVNDRKAALRADAFRSLIFIVLAAGTLYLWQLKKLKTNLFIGLLGFLILIDLWAVDKRYLNNDNFVSKREAKNPFPEMPVDKAILQDKDLNYRVLPMQGDAFQDARSSYHHKSVGGYHAAKLRRYQEIIENQISPELQVMVQGLQSGSSIDSVFEQTPVINMLNTRYIIYDLNSAPLKNPRAMGNAWFVENYKVVENADEEIEVLKGFEPGITATVDKRFLNFIEGKQFQKNNSDNIYLTEYQPNYLKYTSKSQREGLAVFSEIYYNKGWNAYLNGEKIPHFRANYVLRAMVIPEGEHTVEFKFEPKSYYTGNKISLASSILLLLAIVGYGFSEYKRKTKKDK